MKNDIRAAKRNYEMLAEVCDILKDLEKNRDYYGLEREDGSIEPPLPDSGHYECIRWDAYDFIIKAALKALG